MPLILLIIRDQISKCKLLIFAETDKREIKFGNSLFENVFIKDNGIADSNILFLSLKFLIKFSSLVLSLKEKSPSLLNSSFGIKFDQNKNILI